MQSKYSCSQSQGDAKSCSLTYKTGFLKPLILNSDYTDTTYLLIACENNSPQHSQIHETRRDSYVEARASEAHGMQMMSLAPEKFSGGPN